jgi:hypothetical protein
MNTKTEEQIKTAYMLAVMNVSNEKANYAKHYEQFMILLNSIDKKKMQK